MKTLIAILALSTTLHADALADLAGPVIPLGSGPWGWYEATSKANTDDVPAAFLAYPPILGSAYTGTWDLTDTCNTTLVVNSGGATTGEFTVGDWVIVGWNAANGTGTGHYRATVNSKNSTTLTLDQCQLTTTISATTRTGLTVYRCGIQCRTSVTIGGFDVYNATTWGVTSTGVGGPDANFYDAGAGIYRMYLRTGTASYLTLFRTYTDLWWLWALDQGGKVLIPMRGVSLYSQYMRALDGHPERLDPLYLAMKQVKDFNIWPVSGVETREDGYNLLFLAVGAKADTDSTRRSFYCTTYNTTVAYWLALQNAAGYFPSGGGPYPFTVGGDSPWIDFAIQHALALGYDNLMDPAICNNSTLATSVLSSATRLAQFQWDYGYAPQNRGMFYNVEIADQGLPAVVAGLRTGTASVSVGSTAVTGSGTAFLSDFSVNDFIGINHNDGNAWTHKITGIADNTHLTLATNWGTQCYTGQFGTTCATTNASNEGFYAARPANTNCGSIAHFCYSFTGNGSPFYNGDRDNLRDGIWLTGWLYKTYIALGTPDSRWKTYGDEYFSASYGGPAGGPGSGLPCSGPACDGVETDYDLGIHSCASDPTIPCLGVAGPPPYPVADAYVWGVKRWAQGSGIGGGDNYLAWRLTTPGPGSPVRLRGLISRRGGVGIR